MTMAIETMTEFETMTAARLELWNIHKSAPLPGNHRDYNHLLARLNMLTALVLAAQLKHLQAETPTTTGE